jgi:hypothetical protein
LDWALISRGNKVQIASVRLNNAVAAAARAHVVLCILKTSMVRDAPLQHRGVNHQPENSKVEDGQRERNQLQEGTQSFGPLFLAGDFV